MIASFHLAEVSKLAGLRLLRRATPPEFAPGLRYAALTAAAPLGAGRLPRPDPGRVGLIAAWDDDEAIDRFLAEHPLAQALRGGWHARLAPTHI